ncbi:base excision dna repair protein [Fusarium flagelliforme]|uniref:Base excision dna repair protein n=2 Tax=Fusarium flagelliforme TaxID=2675880 RepID=A0A395MXH0_9HYPO|nr:base excision dna repair protein [Fusarium flagelliforme]
MARQTRSMSKVQAEGLPITKRLRQNKPLANTTPARDIHGSVQTSKRTTLGSNKAEVSSGVKNHQAAEKKWASWSQHADSTPYPDFARPTSQECRVAHDILHQLHGESVLRNFGEQDGPVQDGVYTNVMDALVVAALSQATSWANAKRAMNNMAKVYGSTFAYNKIVEGGLDKLADALRPGGMQNRKSKILMGLLRDVKARHGNWDLQYLFNVSDEEVTKEVLRYWGLGPKCAHCLMSICLKRDRFAVDTHIYRLSGLWGWRPWDASIEKSQAHLNFRIPDDIKFMLHYEMIVHGRECRGCRGNKFDALNCEYKRRFTALDSTVQQS